MPRQYVKKMRKYNEAYIEKALSMAGRICGMSEHLLTKKLKKEKKRKR